MFVGVLSGGAAGESTSDATDQSAPEEETTYTRVKALEDVSYGDVKRISARVVVPLGRSQEELSATLERAAKEIQEETNADAVMVFAYRPQDDPSGAYTVGKAEYAPNGNWGDAASSAPMRVSVELNNLYFTSPRTAFASGDSVILISSGGQRG